MDIIFDPASTRIPSFEIVNYYYYYYVLGREVISLCWLTDSVRVKFVEHKIQDIHCCHVCNFDAILNYKKFPGMFTICSHTEHHIPVTVAQWLGCHHGLTILQTPTKTELSWNCLHLKSANFKKSRRTSKF